MVVRDVLEVLKPIMARTILRTFKTSLVPINHKVTVLDPVHDFVYLYWITITEII